MALDLWGAMRAYELPMLDGVASVLTLFQRGSFSQKWRGC
jgi:hypothetical protein